VWDGVHRFQLAVQLVLPESVGGVAVQVVENSASAVFVVPASPRFGEGVHDAELRR
jgi:hypothetical protein